MLFCIYLISLNIRLLVCIDTQCDRYRSLNAIGVQKLNLHVLGNFPVSSISLAILPEYFIASCILLYSCKPFLCKSLNL